MQWNVRLHKVRRQQLIKDVSVAGIQMREEALNQSQQDSTVKLYPYSTSHHAFNRILFKLLDYTSLTHLSPHTRLCINLVFAFVSDNGNIYNCFYISKSIANRLYKIL